MRIQKILFQEKPSYDLLNFFLVNPDCITFTKITNFDRLPYTFDVKLKKPYTSSYPEDYVQWMHQQGKKPIGSYLPIGNFKGYTESVGDLYQIFVKNNKIDQTVELVL